MLSNTTLPTLTLDVDLYQHYLDGSDLTDEQKKELLGTLWNIVCSFVQMGFNVHPVQQAQQSCGKDLIPTLPVTQADSSTLDSKHNDVIGVFIKEGA